MVNEGMVCIPFMAGRVMCPVAMSVISKSMVSLGLSLLVDETDILDAPTNFMGPCICPIIVVAMKRAARRVKNFFIVLR